MFSGRSGLWRMLFGAAAFLEKRLKQEDCLTAVFQHRSVVDNQAAFKIALRDVR